MQVETAKFASKSQEDEVLCHSQQDTQQNETPTDQGLCLYKINEKKIMAVERKWFLYQGPDFQEVTVQ